MINGYITFNELKIITGLEESLLKELLLNGLSQHEIEVQSVRKRAITQQLFNLEEVIKWISIHIL